MKYTYIPLCFSALLSSILANASEMTHGEMAGVIRSFDLPCSHVLNLEESGKDSWLVSCNAGSYNVTKNSEEEFSVSVVQNSQENEQ